MRESTYWRSHLWRGHPWRTPRFLVLIAVVALHVTLIALLLASGGPRRGSSSYQPIELVYIPATPPPPVRADTGKPPRLRADIALSPVSPMITSAPSVSNSSATGSHGLGVDWLAEAHRAVKAYAMRRDEHSDNSLSGKSSSENSWQQGHHEGDQYKTDAGDWIVWIDAHCYKVASWQSADPAANVDSAKIVCPKKPGDSH